MVDLNKIQELTPEMIVRLKAAWIESAEQLASIGIQPTGPSTIADHLGISLTRSAGIIDSAWRVLPAETARRLRSTGGSEDFGLGSLQPTDNEDEGP
jgi:hypothetical protein